MFLILIFLTLPSLASTETKTGSMKCEKLNVTTAWKGKILSPGYPEYSSNLNCSWLIEVATGNVIEALFTRFELSSFEDQNSFDADCKTAGDYLKVFDGSSTNATQIGIYCGWKTGLKIKSTSNKLFLNFMTDSTKNFKGFQLDYIGICRVNLTFPGIQNPSGIISSPGFPKNYLPLMKCSWIIEAGYGLNVNIWVRMFRLEKQFHCSYDYLSFYKGLGCQSKAQIKENYCGEAKIPSFTNRGSLSICFESDYDGQDLGFSLAYSLSDIDECADSSLYTCHHKAHCKNTYGSYNCVCKFGYYGTGKNCTRSPDFAFVNECTKGTHNCHYYADCTDTDDEFYCTCKKGFVGNGTHCQDIDECKTGERVCNKPNAICVNSPGSASCMCKDGYQGDGYNCTDIDECNLVNGSCHPQATCNNTIGSFSCSCNRGFTGNQTYCARLTRVPGATLGQEWQYISVDVKHENRSSYEQGDAILYRITLKHKDANATDSYSVATRFYLPHFLTFGNCTACPENALVKLVNNQLIVTIDRLLLGSSANFTFATVFDEDRLLGKGHHYVVTPIELTWHNTYTLDKRGAYLGSGKKYEQPRTVDINGVEVPGCSKPLGMTDGSIKMHQILASTSVPSNRPEAASYTKNGWCALRTDTDPFIQVILATKSRITKVTTWSRTDKSHWVITYEMQYSLDNVEWRTYGENGFPKLFPGNTELSVPVDHWLLYPVVANHIRLLPRKKNVMACMRFELYGCSISPIDNCVDPIGMESGKIPDDAIVDDLMGSHNPPSNVRLNKKVTSYPFGWQASSGNTPPTYIQVDLGSIFKVTRFAIQGSNNDPKPIFFVKSYQVSSSNTSIKGDWTFVKTPAGGIKTFVGPQDDEQAKYPFPVFLPTPMYARYFRVYPGSYHSMKVMRMEMYGCVADPQPKNIKKIPQEFNRRLILLDKKNNVFYACSYKTKGTSCYFTSDGKLWQEVSKNVVGVLAYNQADRLLYGLAKDLRFMFSRDYTGQWTYITTEEWARVKTNTSVIHSVHLEDILVGAQPKGSNHQWASSNGYVWGVSGKGIHLKPYVEASWQLAATWKCCGQ